MNKEEFEAAKSRVNELENLILDISTDLMIRGARDSSGVFVVDLSYSIWRRMKKAIAKTK